MTYQHPRCRRGGPNEHVEGRHHGTALCAEDILLDRDPTDVALHFTVLVGEDELHLLIIGEEGKEGTRDVPPTVEGGPPGMGAQDTVRVLPNARKIIKVARLEGVIICAISAPEAVH